MKHLVKIRKRRLPGSILCWILIAVFVFLISFPFLYILSTALKSDQDLATSVGRILPEFFEWSNFAKAWELLDFPINFLNSFVVSSAVTLLTILLCSLAAYVFTRLEFKGRNIMKPLSPHKTAASNIRIFAGIRPVSFPVRSIRSSPAMKFSINRYSP